MKDKIPFVPLKEIATINQGLSVRSKIWKSSTREEIEDLYGLQKNDVVILRKMYSNGKKIAALVPIILAVNLQCHIELFPFI